MEMVKEREYSLSLAGMKRVIFAPERWSEKPSDAMPYLVDHADAGNILAVARPASLEELQGLLTQAARSGLAVYTPMPFGLEPQRPGVIVDQAPMDRILSLDVKKLTARIETGVTWDRLLPEVEALGLRMALPAAARHPYVLPAYQEREILLSASRYTNKQLSNLHMVLADGRIYKGGSHALPHAEEHGVNWREDGGPNISRLMLGSRNMFGLAYLGYVYLYPHFEERRVTVLGFEEEAAALKAAQFISRREMAVECLVLNRAKAEAVTGETAAAPWLVVAALEGTRDLVDYYRRRLDEELGGAPELPDAAPAFAEALKRPWNAPDGAVGFYTLFSRVEEFDTMLNNDVPRMVVPVKRGASVYTQYELPVRPALQEWEKLLDAGAFPSGPHGALAHAVYRRHRQVRGDAAAGQAPPRPVRHLEPRADDTRRG